MANIQATKKWSELSGIAIVSLEDGKKLGTCDDFFFEPATTRVYGLRVKTGMLGHRVLLTTSINNIGQDAITTANEEQLISESELKNMPTVVAGHNLDGYRVMSENGTVVGKLGNVLIDVSVPNNLRIASFELAGTILQQIGNHYHTFAADRVVRYGADVLVIPDDIAQNMR